MLEMRWRIWLTQRYLGDWLGNRSTTASSSSTAAPTTPTSASPRTCASSPRARSTSRSACCSSVVTLVSFVGDPVEPLRRAAVHARRTDDDDPGYMVWVALVYAVVGSVLTHFVGRPPDRPELPAGALRGRLPLRAGAPARERRGRRALPRRGAPRSADLLDRIRADPRQLVAADALHEAAHRFTVGYDQVAIVFPFFVAAPRYFSGAIPLGGLMQIA